MTKAQLSAAITSLLDSSQKELDRCKTYSTEHNAWIISMTTGCVLNGIASALMAARDEDK